MNDTTEQVQFRGVVAMPKSHFWDEVWLEEPFSRGQAWLDLWALANDRRRLLSIRGVQVQVERGQLAWSLPALAERWRWGRNKVRSFLADMQDGRKVSLKPTNVITIVTLLDYRVYNPETEPELPLPLTAESTAEGTTEGTPNGTADSTPESTAEGTTEGIQNRELRNREGNRERGRGAPPPPGAFAEVPTDSEVEAFCQAWPGDLARGIPGGIPEVWWTGWLASRLGSERGFPAQWRRVLALSFVSDWVGGHAKARGEFAKKGAPGSPAGGGLTMERGELLQQRALERAARVQTGGLASAGKNAAAPAAATQEARP